MCYYYSIPLEDIPKLHPIWPQLDLIHRILSWLMILGYIYHHDNGFNTIICLSSII